VPSCILQRDTRRASDSRAKTAHGKKTGDIGSP
jgi:hypothetical protein